MTATDLHGRVAIVTGGGGGIGRATVNLLAERGAAVVAADLDEEGARSVADTVVAAGGSAIGLSVDIADPTSVDTMVAATMAAFGRIDVLDNNAAMTSATTGGRDRGVLDTDLEVFDASIAVNLRGTLLVCRAVLPIMIDQQRGSIINISSMNGLAPKAGMRMSYGIAKAGINLMTRQIAAAHGKQGIRCNAVAPGATQTAVFRSFVTPEEVEDKLRLGQYLLPYLGEPEDIADAVAFLASDASRYITGQIISVDGGVLAHSLE